MDVVCNEISSLLYKNEIKIVPEHISEKKSLNKFIKKDNFNMETLKDASKTRIFGATVDLT